MDLTTFRAHYANSGGSVECGLFKPLDSEGADGIYSRNQLNFFTNSRDKPADQIFIFFSDEGSVGVKTMRKYDPLQVILSEHSRNRKVTGYP